MKGSESCIGCKSKTSTVNNFYCQGKKFSGFYVNIDGEVVSKFELKHFKYMESIKKIKMVLGCKQV